MVGNLGVYTNPKHDLYVGKADEPGAPGPKEVTLHIIACGICGSDCHFQHEGHIGPAVIEGEFILGHECSGVIANVGSEVTHLKVGDRVSVDPGENCGECEQCTTGAYNGCAKIEFKSTPPYQGLLRTYVNHPARLCHKIGDMSFEEGALLEPLSVGLAGIEQSGLKIGDATVVCGAGPIGIITALLARTAGASPLAITDLNQARLDLAKQIIPGISTVLVKRETSSQDVASQIIEVLGQKAAIALECTGFESSIAAAIYSLKFRGVCEVIGVGKPDLQIPFMHFSFNEMTIKGLFRYTNTWPRAINLVNSKVIDIKKLVSFKYAFQDAAAAFAKASDPKSTGIKAMIFDDEYYKKNIQ